MTSNTMIVRSRNDLLAMPIGQLGFVPEESLVTVFLEGARVLFSARFDLSELESGWYSVRERLLHAAIHCTGGNCGGWILLAYTQAPASLASTLDRFASVLGQVRDVFVTDGVCSWALGEDGICDEEPFVAELGLVGWDDPGSATRTRCDVIRTVGEWEPREEWVRNSREIVWAMSEDEQVELLRSLLEEGCPVGIDATMLATLLGEEVCFGECVAQMTRRVASQRRETLTQARREAPREALANVTALLGLACWLEGNGTLLNACLEEMATIDPEHPLARMLETVSQLGIPPARWDER